MLTIEGAEALTESVIKLWEVNGGNPRSRFFHMSNQDFVAWRDGFPPPAAAAATSIAAAKKFA